MHPNDVVDVIGMIVVVAGILVLTRPGSQGPALASGIGNSFIGALGGATGANVTLGNLSLTQPR